jgi:hypothetical protein
MIEIKLILAYGALGLLFLVLPLGGWIAIKPHTCPYQVKLLAMGILVGLATLLVVLGVISILFQSDADIALTECYSDCMESLP